MLNFCTLYNSNYAAKGLAMYRSLKGVCTDFHLYIFAFDDVLAEALEKMALPQVTVITLAEFEDEDLLRIKPTRSVAEYCWTCTSSTILYCLTHFEIDQCTYVDSDIFFLENPRVMIDEIGSNDILITPHWFDKDHDNSHEVGKYCVQFVTAKNTPNGLRVISDWRNDCIKWCYSHYEDGKMGDQMYLDVWPEKYEGICVSENMGGGVAPWNMHRYDFEKKDEKMYAREINMNIYFPVIFVHFHFVYTYRKGLLYHFSFDTYPIKGQCAELIYRPYLRVLFDAYKEMRKVNPEINGLAVKEEPLSWFAYIRERIARKRHRDYKHVYCI